MMKTFFTKGAISLLLLSLLASCAELGISPPVPGRGSPPPGNQSVAVTVSIDIAAARRLAIASNITGLRGLPPGIQRNLQRGKQLPPGIARQLIPGIMLTGLPVYPDMEWRIAGRDLVLIAIGTLIIVEILSDVFE